MVAASKSALWQALSWSRSREKDLKSPGDTVASWNLKPTCRSELEFTRCDRARATLIGRSSQTDTSAGRWIVFDPVTRRSARVGQFEYDLLQRCNGNTAVRSLVQECASKHGAETELTVLAALNSFHSNGFFQPSIAEDHVWGRPKKKKSTPWTPLLSNLVVWKLRGINVDRLLGVVANRSGWLFSRFAVRIWLFVAATSLLAVLVNAGRLLQQQHLWEWVTRPYSSVGLLVVFLLTRAAHELGHALACKRHGVRCPDIGFLFVLGTPCLYCDVSESWRLKNRWHRASIAAAGIYVELVIAALASWLWLFTDSGSANTLALQTMFVCSISTILINANPLMRFDGYHILADWADEVHLRQRADQSALDWLVRWILGAHDRGRAAKWWYVPFSIASFIYRITLTTAISAMLVAMYSQWNLPWVGRIFAGLVLVSTWGGALMNFAKLLNRNAASRIQRSRMWGFVAIVILVVLCVPIPQRILLDGWLKPKTLHGVYAGSDAQLVQCLVRDGQRVDLGDELFRFASSDVQLDAIQSSSDADIARMRHEMLRRQRDMHGEDIDLSQAASAQETAILLAESDRLQVQRLKLTSPASGVFSSSHSALSNESAFASLGDTQWVASEQLGRSVAEGTLLGTVGSSDSVVVLPLDNSQVSDVSEGMPVQVRLPMLGYPVTAGEVAAIVKLDEFSTEDQLSRAGRIEGSTNFAALVRLPSTVRCRSGTRVKAALKKPSITLAATALRWARLNVHLLAD